VVGCLECAAPLVVQAIRQDITIWESPPRFGEWMERVLSGGYLGHRPGLGTTAEMERAPSGGQGTGLLMGVARPDCSRFFLQGDFHASSARAGVR
jgi:hypothetical protein